MTHRKSSSVTASPSGSGGMSSKLYLGDCLELMKDIPDGSDVKPVQRPADPSLEEDEFDTMPIEKINQYLREHGYNPEKVGLRGKILVEALTKNIIAREIIQRFLNKEGGCRFCEYDKYLPLDAPKNGHEEGCLYLAARAYLDNDTSTVVKRDLSDAEIEELGAAEAESRGDK